MLSEWEQALQQQGHSPRKILGEDTTDATILAAFAAFYGSKRDRGLRPRITCTTDSGGGYGILMHLPYLVQPPKPTFYVLGR